ncbi:exodeoxyribonuclease VII small subunit [Jiangella alba]|uniref:Exodeoxyribonuclease 7 small subunit n=1 Tax=Jiangella alba TaxID=561176 RepID=A0A1H5PV46_9ACTN|nr:exodeoxyribonuclease VII small subunit [Jiangella alba]SEF17579.1 Exodeoxyribonuclease VII small subunit [Jiangella alba]
MQAAEPTYEEARDELIQIVAKLEAGGTTLEESLALWQRGEELAALCERYLDGARAKLDAASAADEADHTSPS